MLRRRRPGGWPSRLTSWPRWSAPAEGSGMPLGSAQCGGALESSRRVRRAGRSRSLENVLVPIDDRDRVESGSRLPRRPAAAGPW